MFAQKILTNLLRLEELQIPAFNVLSGARYIKHGGRDFSGSHSLQYHRYLTTASYKLKDAVGSPHNTSIAACKHFAEKSERKNSNWMQTEQVETINPITVRTKFDA